MFDEQSSDLLRRVPANFGDARGQIGVHVGITIERSFDPIEFFGVICKVDADERRV